MALYLTRGTIFYLWGLSSFQFHMSLIKHWTFLHTNLVLSVFLFCFLFYQCSYALTHTHVLNCISISTLDPVNNNPAIASYDFKNPINQAEDEGEEDCEVPGELARLLQREERAIQPHEEPVETINLGTEMDRKKKSRSAQICKLRSNSDWYRCCTTTLRFLPGHMKTCLV